jgi:hypothetical protein
MMVEWEECNPFVVEECMMVEWEECTVVEVEEKECKVEECIGLLDRKEFAHRMEIWASHK